MVLSREPDRPHPLWSFFDVPDVARRAYTVGQKGMKNGGSLPPGYKPKEADIQINASES
jgi:hypothetical protein